MSVYIIRDVMIRTAGIAEVNEQLMKLLEAADVDGAIFYRDSLRLNGEPATIDQIAGIGANDVVRFAYESNSVYTTSKSWIAFEALMALVDEHPVCGAVVGITEELTGCWIEEHGNVTIEPVTPHRGIWHSYYNVRIKVTYPDPANRDLFRRYREALDYDFMVAPERGWAGMILGEDAKGFEIVDMYPLFDENEAYFEFGTQEMCCGTFEELEETRRKCNRIADHVREQGGQLTFEKEDMMICGSADTGTLIWISEDLCQMTCEFSADHFSEFKVYSYSL